MRNKFGRKQNEQKEGDQTHAHNEGGDKEMVFRGEIGEGRTRAGNSENVKSQSLECDVRRRRKSISATSFQ